MVHVLLSHPVDGLRGHNHRLIDHRVICWLERGALLLSLLYLCLHTMPRAWNKLNTDFPNYYLSARIAHEGSDRPAV
jgi:hypothetical protein